ncbi:hypothetical protein [uncultured Polaribacter sp.]|uniref:hypothetical protein n=1 Tax=uncultured Polaribacter sp. TaxID=174711 RepID=UPI002626E344|nr:hypothetical protein [uncultured Polaribacter sp.]
MPNSDSITQFINAFPDFDIKGAISDINKLNKDFQNIQNKYKFVDDFFLTKDDKENIVVAININH